MNWALLDALEQKQIADLGWKPTYVSFTYIDGDINQPVTLYGPTGEDFLYMHHEMVEAVNAIGINASPEWQVVGWENCPDPDNDGGWPVPEAPDTGSADYEAYLNSYKTRDFYRNTIVPAEQWIADEDNLLSMTLGELGVKLEYELHTYFHVRYAAYNPVGYRMQDLHPTSYIDPMWDDEDYDYLADFYSAHVNPTFWKIHGWVEDRIEDWRQVNQIDSLTWVSTWEMGPMNATILAALEQVAVDAKNRDYHRESQEQAGVIVGSVFGGLIVGFIVAMAIFLCMLKVHNARAHQAKPAARAQEVKSLKGSSGTQVNQEEQIQIAKN